MPEADVPVRQELYSSLDSRISFSVYVDDHTAWLTAHQLSAIFDTPRGSVQNLIDSIYKTEMISRDTTCRRLGAGPTSMMVDHYSLRVLYFLSQRIESPEARRFNAWAGEVVEQHMRHGFSINRERLANDPVEAERFNREASEFRTSERQVWQQLQEVFKTSTDYTPSSLKARFFYQNLQNLWHNAIHEQGTAADLVMARFDPNAENFGLVNFKGVRGPSLDDCFTGKNYLTANELEQMTLLCEQFFIMVRLYRLRGKPMKLDDWLERVKAFLKALDLAVLEGYGRIRQQEMRIIVKKRYLLAKPKKETQLSFHDLVLPIRLDFGPQGSVQDAVARAIVASPEGDPGFTQDPESDDEDLA